MMTATIAKIAAEEARAKARAELDKILQLVECKSGSELEVVAAAAGIDKEFEDQGFCYMLCFGLAKRSQWWLLEYIASQNSLLKPNREFFRKAWHADEYSMNYEHEEDCDTRIIMLICCNIELFRKNLDKVKEISEIVGNED